MSAIIPRMAFTVDMVLGEFEDAAGLGGGRSAERAEVWGRMRDAWRLRVAMEREIELLPRRRRSRLPPRYLLS